MNGKEYVAGAIEKAERILGGLRSSDKLSGDPLVEGLESACEALGRLKNKPTLRTRAGTNLAIPVYEAAEGLEEAWEEAEAGEDREELQSRIEEFVGAVEVLGGALKERTVIMT